MVVSALAVLVPGAANPNLPPTPHDNLGSAIQSQARPWSRHSPRGDFLTRMKAPSVTCWRVLPQKEPPAVAPYPEAARLRPLPPRYRQVHHPRNSARGSPVGGVADGGQDRMVNVIAVNAAKRLSCALARVASLTKPPCFKHPSHARPKTPPAQSPLPMRR